MQGLLLLDKPENMTSYGAVACIKRVAGEKRVGHTGTLDPMATGVLPVFLGRATALSSYLLDADKRYTAEIKLGVTTDTCDRTGTVLQNCAVEIDHAQLLPVLHSFVGKGLQTPPMYSALKKDGVRLYQLARQGKTVDIPEREIEVFELNVVSPLDANGCFTIDVRVSKGTYIRSLARDIGDKLGCGAMLTKLCRTATSGFSLSQCISPEILTPDNLSEHLLSEEIAVAGFLALQVTDKQAVRFCNGGQLSFDRIKVQNPEDGQLFRVRFEDRFLGLGFADCERQEIAIRCVINDIRTSDNL